MAENEMVATRAEVFFKYDGADLREGLIPVTDIAPALIGIGALFTEANRVLNGRRTAVVVNVQAPERGSFGVGLVVDQTIIDVIKALFIEGHVKTAGELIEIVAGGGGLVALIQFLRGLRAKKEEKLPTGEVRLTNVDGNVQIFQAPVTVLYQDPAIREAAKEVVRPLRRKGVEVLEVRGDSEIVRVRQEDLPSFETNETLSVETVIHDTTGEQVYQILKPSFDPNLSFYVSDGSIHLDVYIRDEDFMRRVDRGDVTFRAHDLLYTETRIVTYLSDRGTLRARREVVKVLNHQRAIEQVQTTLYDPPKPPDQES